MNFISNVYYVKLRFYDKNNIKYDINVKILAICLNESDFVVNFENEMKTRYNNN